MRIVAMLATIAAASVQAEAGVQRSTTAANHRIIHYRVDKPFADVVFELNFAITDHNFRITGRNTIGEGLRERGYTDFPDVEVIHFCSLELAREVLLLDPAYVAQMPCRIAVHEEGGATVVSLIELPLDHPDPRVNAFARRMNALMTEIVEFAVAP